MARTQWKKIILIVVVFLAVVLNGSSFAEKNDSFSFVHFSDVHIPSYLFPISQPLDEATLMKMHNSQRLQQFVQECLEMKPKPAFIINSGDTGDAGWTPLLKLYQRLMLPLATAGISVYTAVGNHDLDYAGIGVQDLSEIFDTLGPEKIGRHGTRYSFDFNSCHFVFLNNRPITGLIRLTPSDIEWLRKDLNPVKKDSRVILVLHANMPEEDTHNVVELLQPFKYPIIFQGHAHSESINRWGGVPVVVTGALYGGKPEAGSYRIVTVSPEKITVKTRDFAKTAAVYEPDQEIEYSKPGPKIHIISPKSDALATYSVSIALETKPAGTGAMEFSIPGFLKWTPMKFGNGKWEAAASLPANPGRHLLTFQFKGDDGSISLAHTVIKVPGEKVHEAWTRELCAAIQGAPVIWQNLAIVPTRDGGVYALRLDNGKITWHRKYEQGQIIGRAVSNGASVFYGAGRSVYACSAKTGKTLWQTPLNGTVIAGLTMGDNRLFVPAGEHKLFCLDSSSGKIMWDFTVTLPIMMEPATMGGMVFFGGVDGYIHALDALTGKEIWKNQVSSMNDDYTTAPFWPPVIANNKVIISKLPAGKDERNLIAFDTSTGKVSWSRQLSGAPFRLTAGAVGDNLYTPGPGGLQCISAKDGSALWNQSTGVGMFAGIVSGDALLIRDDDEICCADEATGKVRWIYHTSTGPQGSYYGPGAFAAKDNQVIVGTMDGNVIALKW
jgi:outer membrane protein assembly factor BamB